MVKRLPVFLLILVFCSVSLFTAAEEAWTCPDCGQAGNAGNFCTNCGAPCPDASSAGPSLQSDAGGGAVSVPGLEDLPLLDPVLYPGSPKDAYAAILQKHEAGMLAYEEHVIEYEDSED